MFSLKTGFPFVIACGALLANAPRSQTTTPCVPEERVELEPFDGTAQNRFGWAVALDGRTLVAGADEDGEFGALAGAAYVFERTGPTNLAWVEIAKLTASDAAAGDMSGFSVALSDDFAAAGASMSDAAGLDSGAVYLFERDLGGTNAWGERKKLVGSDTKAGDLFGWSVSLSGDVLVVGALMGSTNQTGAAYVFERDLGGPDNWGQRKKLVATDATMDDRFGRAVSVDGDLVLVTADGNDDAGSSSGSAYVFGRNIGGTNNWGQGKKLTASDPTAVDHFGIDGALSGDTIVIGAHLEDTGGLDSGSAYVFERNLAGTNNWGEEKKLVASDSMPGNRFGRAVSIAGDWIAVGAFASPVAGTSAGEAYVFERDLGGAASWGEVTALLASDGATGDNFGWDVAASPRLFAIGAPKDGALNLLAGSVYLFACDLKTAIPNGGPRGPVQKTL